MQKKQVSIIPKSMQQDLAVSQFPADAAYNIRNMRLVTAGANTTLALVNEKGNSLSYTVNGKIIGAQVLNDVLVIFVTDIDNTGLDAIYKLKHITDFTTGETILGWPDGDGLLFKGNLGFDTTHPIESIGIYESENIQKVYWVDGIHQPRFINICKKAVIQEDTTSKYTGFDFVITASSNLSVEIEKETTKGTGLAPGVIQYAITLYNLNGSQTGIIYQSPLLYSTGENRGLDAESVSPNTFRLYISGFPSNFEYIRIYRLLYTSINATPSVEIVGDYSTKNQEALVFRGQNSTWNFDKIISVAYDLVSNTTLSKAFNGPDKRLIKENSTSYIIDNRDSTDPNSRRSITIKGVNKGGEEEKNYSVIIPSNKSVRIQYAAANDGNISDGAATIQIVDSTEDGTWNGTSDYLDLYEVKKDTISVIDGGTTGSTVNPTELVFMGMDPLIPQTMSYKDNTLFLGNIELQRRTISKEDAEGIRSQSTVYFDYQDVEGDNIETTNELYDYNFNLNNSNDYFSFFQYGETYRVGVTFLHKTGAWSEVIYLGDFVNDKRVIPNKINGSISKKPIIKARIYVSSALQDYIAARLVCVFPSDGDREVVCQGVLLPTLFNVDERLHNSPYAQSDWFARPNFIATSSSDSFGNATSPSEMYKNRHNFKGVPLEYRHLYSVSAADRYNSEVIYGNQMARGGIDKNSDEDTREQSIVNNNHYLNFGIDKSIVTLHSPELDTNFRDDVFNTTGLKLRVVGYAPVKHNISNLRLEAENAFNPYTIGGFHYNALTDRASYNGTVVTPGGVGLVSYPYWIDNWVLNANELVPSYNNPSGGLDSYWAKSELYWFSAFPIYPWHKSGSLNNQGTIDNEANRKSNLLQKSMSTLRVASSTQYLSTPLDLAAEDIQLFNSDEVTLTRINAWGKTINYYGNIDYILQPIANQPKYIANFVPSDNVQSIRYFNHVTEPVTLAPSEFISTNYSLSDDLDKGLIIDNIHLYLPLPNDGVYRTIAEVARIANETLEETLYQGIEPVSIKYKSTSHAVIALGKTADNKNIILPYIKRGEWNERETEVNPYGSTDNSTFNYEWQKKGEDYNGWYQDSVLIDNDTNHPFNYYYVIGELYRDVINKFGGTSQSALESNTWHVCGPTIYVNLSDANVNFIELEGTIGDTYYMRYDHLKTYPFTREDMNQITDIISFYCETRINIDGRYDRNRGLEDNTNIDKTNFNLFNPVYSQLTTILDTSKYLDAERLSESKFPNQVVWSMTKTLGEDIDSWTNIPSSSVLDLDGDKGDLVSLSRLNNDIYAFQPKGVSKILYNNRVQINTSDGVPIEIANSGKVDGKIYITSSYGCQDKWSITETPSGLYFVDNFNQGILSFNGQNITDITYTKNMYSWINDEASLSHWDPVNFKSIRTLYDRNNNDIYFTTDNVALAFNERLGAFSSFYDYEKVGWLTSLDDTTYQIRNNQIWKLHGNTVYNSFFGDPHNYSVSIIANPEFQLDKIFDTIEFRTNGNEEVSYGNIAETTPFNFLQAYNDYQTSTAWFHTIKKKFRTWRWPLARDGRNRIRDNWVRLTLTGSYTKEMRLYDMLVTYYLP